MKFLALLLTIFTLSCAAYTVKKPEKKAVSQLIADAEKNLMEGNCSSAEALLKEALSEHRNFKILFMLGLSEALCGKYGASFSSFQRALGYAPDQLWTARTYTAMGLLFLKVKRPKEAEFYFKLAKEAYPKIKPEELSFEKMLSWIKP